ncbi:polycomb group protein Psc-like isoform X2 [Ornithodoros turicata]
MPGAKLADLNSVLSCVLCGGYLVNATTIVECLHSFCRACIVRYLATSKLCPICDVPVHKSRPFNYIRPDKTLQDLVYKMVPGLYQREMKKRREFYEQHPNADPETECLEDRGVSDEKGRVIFSPDDHISLSLEYSTGKQPTESNGDEDGTEKKTDEEVQRRFLNCPAALTISHLQKFIRMKYSLSFNFKIDILYMNDVLYEGYSLMDIAYIYTWKRESPLRLFFRISARPPKRPAVQAVELPSEELVIVEDEAPEELQKEPGKEEAAQLAKSDPVEEKSGSPPQPETPTSESPALRLPQELCSNPEPVSDISCASKADTEKANRNTDSIPQKATANHIVEKLLPTTTLTRTALSTSPPSPEKGEDVATGVVDNALKSAAVPEEQAVGTEKTAKIVSLVQSASPHKEEQAAEPLVEARLPPQETLSPPPLPKITISTLDRNSNKIIIQTKEAPPMVVKMSPPLESHGDKALQPKKSRRKEHKESSRKKCPEKQEKRSLSDTDQVGMEAPPSKRSKQESESMEVDSGRGFDAIERSSPKPNSSRAPQPHGSPHQRVTSPSKSSPVSRPPPAHPQTPKTPPSLQRNRITVTRAEEDTRPLDLSLAHRGPTVVPKKVELAPPFPRPRGRPPLPLPTVSQPLPKQTSTYKVVPPMTPMFQKTPTAAASSHHHHHHHRNSKHLFKGANLTCINPDPNAFHPRIVIKNVPPRGPLNSFHRV